jgi:hypothetical protein
MAHPQKPKFHMTKVTVIPTLLQVMYQWCEAHHLGLDGQYFKNILTSETPLPQFPLLTL